MRRIIQSMTARLLAGLILPPLADQDAVLAVDTTLTTCDETSFRSAVHAVDSGGGGTLTIDCQGPISFSGTDPIQIGADVTIFGNDVRLDGDDEGTLFDVTAGARLALNYLTISDFVPADSQGGAIRNNGTLVVNDTVFRSSSAQEGGAIANFGAGIITITSSTFERNEAGSAGGAIANMGGLVTIVNSTFDGNTSEGAGSAIHTSADSLGDPGETRITASTIVNNRAPDGSAIYTAPGTTGVSTTITGSILAYINDDPNGTGTICGGLDPDSQGSNLINDDSCNLSGPGDQEGSGVTVSLGFLQNNGALTPNRIPQRDSDAVGTADCSVMPAGDQRGVTRPATGCDSDGIYELENGDDPVGVCPVNGIGAVQQISVQVSDGDGGVTSALTEQVAIAYTLCLNRANGKLYEVSGDDCGRMAQAITLPEDGPLTVCAHRVTGQLRLAGVSDCSRYEVARVIGGSTVEPE